jgi:hypothetical protein
VKLAAFFSSSLLLGACSIAPTDVAVPTATPVASSDILSSSAEEASTAAESITPIAQEPSALPNEALDQVTISRKRSSLPKQREWREGKPVDFARDDARCAGRLVREWLRIRCFIPRVAGATLLAGNRDGTSLRLVGAFDELSAASAEIVFPLRSGDRRVIQLTALDDNGEWGGGGESISAMISESWVEEDRGPIVVVTP